MESKRYAGAAQAKRELMKGELFRYFAGPRFVSCRVRLSEAELEWVSQESRKMNVSLSGYVRMALRSMYEVK